MVLIGFYTCTSSQRKWNESYAVIILSNVVVDDDDEMMTSQYSVKSRI